MRVPVLVFTKYYHGPQLPLHINGRPVEPVGNFYDAEVILVSNRQGNGLVVVGTLPYDVYEKIVVVIGESHDSVSALGHEYERLCIPPGNITCNQHLISTLNRIVPAEVPETYDLGDTEAATQFAL